MKRITLAALVAAAAAAAFAVPAAAAPTDILTKPASTIIGTCTFNGVAHFGAPVGLTPTDMDWRFDASGTCTGDVNGQVVQDTPASFVITAHGPVGCTVGYTLNGRFGVTFGNAVKGDRSLTGDIDLVQTVANTLELRGDAAGYALGRTTFIAQNGPPLLTGCVDGTTITTLNAEHTFVTAGPMSG
jgi:hypothetical protein